MKFEKKAVIFDLDGVICFTGAELENDAGIYGCVKMVHLDGQD